MRQLDREHLPLMRFQACEVKALPFHPVSYALCSLSFFSPWVVKCPVDITARVSPPPSHYQAFDFFFTSSHLAREGYHEITGSPFVINMDYGPRDEISLPFKQCPTGEIYFPPGLSKAFSDGESDLLSQWRLPP